MKPAIAIRKTNLKALALLLAGVALATSLATVNRTRLLAQNTNDVAVTLRRPSYAIDDAVKIIGFRLDGKSYYFSKARAVDIQTTSGWLGRLEIIVHNNAPKTMVAGTVQVECPSLNHGPREQMVIDQFTLGTVPDRFRFPSSPPPASLNSTKPPISVEPGKDVTLALGEDFDRMRKKLSGGDPFPDCTVDPLVFFFSDGTMWQPRTFYKPDPGSDHGYVKISPDEFLGRAK